MGSTLRFVVLFSLLFVCLITNIVGAEEDGSIELAMFSSLAKTALTNHSVQKRAVEMLEKHARALIPADFSLVGLGLFGTFKAAIIALGAMFAASSLLPAILGFLGLTVPIVHIRSLSDSLNEVNYMVSRSINDFSNNIQNKSYLLELDGEECRDRAICEVGKFVGRTYPSISFWLQKLGGFDKLILGDQYSLSLVKGMRHQKCEHLFPKCKRNPFANWSEIADKFR